MYKVLDIVIMVLLVTTGIPTASSLSTVSVDQKAPSKLAAYAGACSNGDGGVSAIDGTSKSRLLNDL